MEALNEAEAEILVNMEFDGPDYEVDEEGDMSDSRREEDLSVPVVDAGPQLGLERTGATPLVEPNMLPVCSNIDEMETDSNMNRIIEYEGEADYQPCNEHSRGEDEHVLWSSPVQSHHHDLGQDDQAHVLQCLVDTAIEESIRTKEKQDISEAIRRSQNDLRRRTSDIFEVEQNSLGLKDNAVAGCSTEIDIDIECVMCLEHFYNRRTFDEHMQSIHNVVQTKLEILFQISTSIIYKKTGITWPAGEIISNRGKKRSEVNLSNEERAKRMCLEANRDLNLASSSGSVVSEICPGDSVSLIGHNDPSTPVNQHQDLVDLPDGHTCLVTAGQHHSVPTIGRVNVAIPGLIFNQLVESS